MKWLTVLLNSMGLSRTRVGLIALANGLLACAVSAQTIRPIVSEYETKAEGRVELVNPSDQPLNILIQPRGFTVNEHGVMQDHPLPTSIHVKLSVTSLRIPARQSRFVFYEAVADRIPAWFVLTATFSGFPRRDFSGLNMQLELPHVVYILPKTHWLASDIHVIGAQVHADTHLLVIDIENQGKQFGRISDVEIQAARRKVHIQGFPLFPGVRRRLEVPWDRNEQPDTILVKSKDFSFPWKLSPQNP